MDKKALVEELKQAFGKLEAEGMHLESVHLLPATILFYNESYIVVVASPDFKSQTITNKIGSVSQKLYAHLTPEARRHIQMVWVLDDAEKARKRIDIEDVDEFVIPIIEPAHA